MCDHAEQMKRPSVCRIGIADQPVEPFGFSETAGAMVGQRSCERLFGTAPGIHGDARRSSLARPIAPEAQIHLAGFSVNPDRLIAGYGARRAVYCVACNVRSGMQNEAAAIWTPCSNIRLILNNVGAVMMSV
jgi:hypothetical protein